jgi:hypothetical protein
MGLFDRDYDRDYGYRTGAGYDRGFRERGGFMGNAGYERGQGPRYTANRGGDASYRGRSGGYDRPYWGYDTWRYDEQYKSRAQTDYGDPFGDREANTPIRVIEDRDRDRGWFGGGGRGRGWFGGGRDYGSEYGGYGREYRGGAAGYDRQYGRNPVSYDPYETRGPDRERLRGRTRGYDRGYTGDWF